MSMNKLTKYMLLSCLSFAAIGCVNEDEIVSQENSEKVHMTFTASIEIPSDTKTMLGEKDQYGYRKVLWTPEDCIGVYPSYWNKRGAYEFSNITAESSDKAVFEGIIEDGSETYYALYPYRAYENDDATYSNWYTSDGALHFELPAVQKYVNGTFAPETNVMVAKANRGEDFVFKSLEGILIVNLTGEQTITSLSITAKDEFGEPAKLSGPHSVLMDYAESPVLVAKNEASTMVAIDCGEGVTLNPTEPTPFFVLLPPATYSSIVLTIGTSDGQVMLKEGKNPLTISKQAYVNAGTLQFAAEVAFDLSAKGTANSYIVPEMGLYSFDVSVIGNGEFGLSDIPMGGAYAGMPAYHTTDPEINPVSAEILWDDHRGAIAGLTFDKENKRVNFVATGEEGNAVIAVKDADGTILWSWHLWCTDQPVEHNYVNSNGNFVVLDRNLGATRADRGSDEEELNQSMGMIYQWGRKDPFYATKEFNEWGGFDWKKYYSTIESSVTTQESIQMPNTLARSSYSDWNRDPFMYSLWKTDEKTIYDPCPSGYRVAVSDIFRGFTSTGSSVDRGANINYSGSFDKGFNFLYDGKNTAWYPSVIYHESWNSGVTYSEYEGRVWSANNGCDLRYYYVSDYECSVSPQNSDYTSHAFPVRCMKDESTVKLIVKMDGLSYKAATSVLAAGHVSTYGDVLVQNAGFVVGQTNDVTLSSGLVFESAYKIGDISVSISGLTPLTHYYIRAYATIADVTVYSDVMSFYTPNEAGIVDLSVNGNANCYIVPPANGVYAIKAVKGNSNESVGAVASAEVLWETYNSSEFVTQYSVVASAELDGDMVKFTIPDNARSGNAVIAVKDASGTILWSWHIWVVDFDPVVTQQKYISGAIMMDRNLGALVIYDYDVRTYGLLYQWGRKDPFVNSHDGWNSAYTYPADLHKSTQSQTYEYSISHPTESLVGVDWNQEENLWSSHKTIYDPCPSGWRVPDIGVWDGIPSYSGDFGVHQGGGLLTRIRPPYSEPEACFYLGGCTGANLDHNDFHSSSYWHTIGINSYAEVRSVRIDNYLYANYGLCRDYMIPVRCMKDVPMFGGGNEGFTEDDEIEW